MQGLEPFAALRNLAESVKFQVTRCEDNDPAPTPEWLEELASGLCRVRVGSEEETQRIRIVAQRLRGSEWQRFTRIEVTPYVDGDPAGEPNAPSSFWSGNQLYVANLPIARLHKDLADELSRPFAHSAIATAIGACIDRDLDFVREYLAAGFTLDLIDLDAPRPTATRDPGVTASGNGSAPSEESTFEAADSEVTPDEDDVDSDEVPEDNEDEETQPSAGVSRPRRRSSGSAPSLIERYARNRGFLQMRRQQQTLRPPRWSLHRTRGGSVQLGRAYRRRRCLRSSVDHRAAPRGGRSTSCRVMALG